MKQFTYLTELICNIRRKRKKRAVVLAYHRVAEVERDPLRLAVSPGKFESHMHFIRENFNPLSLAELSESLGKNTFKDRSIVLTFDDGYADNFMNALPVLKKYDIPATFFVSAGMIDSDREFWWDELEKALLGNNTIFGRRLELDIGEKSYDLTINNFVETEILYREIINEFKKIESDKRKEICATLLNWAGKSKNPRENCKLLSAAEIKKISEDPLFEIASHTVSHISMGCENSERRFAEVDESKKILEAVIGKQVYGFSYPYGRPGDFLPGSSELLKRAGYTYAVTNMQNAIYDTCDKFHIPRRLVRNWDINKFSEMMDIFFSCKDISSVLSQKLRLTFSMGRKAEAKLKELKNRTMPKSSETVNSELRNVLQINKIDCRGGAAGLAFSIHGKLRENGFGSSMLVSEKLSNDENIQLILKSRDPKNLELIKWQEKNGWQDVFYTESFNISEHEFFKNADIIHFHNLHNNYFSPLALPVLTSLKPAVWTIHDMQALTGHCAHSLECEKWKSGCGRCPDMKLPPPVKRDETAFIYSLKKEMYDESCFTLVCPSEWMRAKLNDSMLSGHRIELIYNGVNQNIFRPVLRENARKELGIPSEKTVLLFCSDGSDRNPWKGGRILKRIWESLPDKNILLIKLGGDNLKSENDLLEIPYIENRKILALYYSAADLFVYPSFADNCPLTILESLSCGLPVISTKTGGIPELVRHMETGYLAPCGDTDDFLRGIRTFVDNKDLMKKAAVTAVEDARKHFSLDLMFEKYRKLYELVLTDRREKVL